MLQHSRASSWLPFVGACSNAIKDSIACILLSVASDQFTTHSLEPRTDCEIIAGSYSEQNTYLAAIAIEYAALQNACSYYCFYDSIGLKFLFGCHKDKICGILGEKIMWSGSSVYGVKIDMDITIV